MDSVYHAHACRKVVARKFLWIFVPLAILVSLKVFVLSYANIRENRVVMEINERRSVEWKARELTHRLDLVISDLLVLSGHQELSALLEKDNDASREALSDEFQIFCERKRIYHHILLVDTEGKAWVTASRSADGEVCDADMATSDSQFVDDWGHALPRDGDDRASVKIEMAPCPAIGNDKGPPALRASASVFDSKGRRMGAVIVDCDPAFVLEALARRETVGDLLLVDAQGRWLLASAPPDEQLVVSGWGDERLNDSRPEVWRGLNNGVAGQFRSETDMFTYTKVLPPRSGMTDSLKVDMPSWRIVSFAPKDIVTADTRRRLRLVAMVSSVLGVLLAFGCWKMARAIADRDQARVELTAQREEAIQVKEKFLAIATHDLRGYLSKVIGYADLVATRLNPGDVVGDLDHTLIKKTSQVSRRARHTVEDLLDFHASEDGALSLDMAPTNINRIAQQTADNNADYAEEKQIDIELNLAEELPAIYADARRLNQVVENFVSNAIKFSPLGSSVRVVTSNGQAKARFEVTDSGPGLAASDFSQLFVPYAKLSAKPTAGEKSTGFGLAVCKELIERHGGKLGARNNPDHGATFWFEMPIERG